MLKHMFGFLGDCPNIDNILVDKPLFSWKWFLPHFINIHLRSVGQVSIKNHQKRPYNYHIGTNLTLGSLIWSRDIVCLHILLHRKNFLCSKICKQIMSLEQMRDHYLMRFEPN